MKYPYEDFSPEQFEELVVVICQKLFGISVQGFSKGPDGGRDAKFLGKANLFPSEAKPWEGLVIIQAKHTNGYNKSFSDPDFFGKKNKKNVLAKEIPRIKKLKSNKQLDHYLLFSNRRLAGNAETGICNYISVQTGVPVESIRLGGVEQIESYLKHFPDITNVVNIDPIDCPLNVSPNDLSDIILAFSNQIKTIQATIEDAPVSRVSFEKKNQLNNMSAEYAKGLRNRFLKDTSSIKNFLAAPENSDILRLYENVVDEFFFKIVSKRKDFQSFDDLFNYLIDMLFSRDVMLRGNKRLTRAMLFYMYWNCDIGVSEDVAAN